MIMLENVKVGDRLWHIRHGWSRVIEVNKTCRYEIITGVGSFTLDGCVNENDLRPSLFWDEVKFEYPKEPLPDLAIDTKLIVWDSPNNTYKRYFSHFNEVGEVCCFAEGNTSWTANGKPTCRKHWRLYGGE